MTLPEYIRKHGVTVCAERFKVTERTVYNWLERKSFPQRAIREHVQKVSGLRTEQIYG